ncbi:hypothetical protein NMG60_11009418 [Bertholletia excelsa]
MDMGGKDNFEQGKRNDDLVSYHPLDSIGSIPSMESIPSGISIPDSKGGLIESSSSCSSAFMIGSLTSLCPTVWDHPTSTLQNLSFSDINLQNRGTPSNTLAMGKGTLGLLANSVVQGGLFLPTLTGMLPPSLSNFPIDSGFIERAARFSCFSRGNFSELMNSSGISEYINPCAMGAPLMQRSQDLFGRSGLKSLTGGQSQPNEAKNMAEASKAAWLSVKQGATEGSPLKNERKSNNFVKSHDQAKPSVVFSGNESEEAEFSGGCGDDGQEELSSSKKHGLKKRKRGGQDIELGQAKETSKPSCESAMENAENQHKGDQTPTSMVNKPSGKYGKQGSQAFASDSPKEEYIHVRARRGQATNSHSLAERVRREKISERMKYLQDLVPGCSKVTGKAVMLDEIINYVQSLQRQVEFLSMKLATVNPRLDCNLEALLAKDILQSRAGPSSTLACSLDMAMPFPPMHPSQPGLIQKGLSGMANSSEALQRSINGQLTTMSGGYKEHTPQVPNMWGKDELHNVVQMGFNSSAPLHGQDLNGSMVQGGHEKVEL